MRARQGRIKHETKRKRDGDKTWKTFGCMVGKMSEQATNKARKFKQNNIIATATTSAAAAANNYLRLYNILFAQGFIAIAVFKQFFR